MYQRRPHFFIQAHNVATSLSRVENPQADRTATEKSDIRATAISSHLNISSPYIDYDDVHFSRIKQFVAWRVPSVRFY
jgi:hypothetical protein